VDHGGTRIQVQGEAFAGKSNVIADTLSRYPVIHCDEDEDPLQVLFPAFMITETGTCFEPYLEEIMNYMMIGNQMNSTQIKKRAQRGRFENEHLYRKVGDRFVKIPYIDERGEILRQCHDGHGQFGSRRYMGKAISILLVPTSVRRRETISTIVLRVSNF
jgi:hypothetical protein